MATEIFLISFKVEENGNKKELDLDNLQADLFCGFAENVANDLICRGIRRAKKLKDEINDSKIMKKKYEKLLNDFYNTDYKIIEAFISDTGMLWNYVENEYYYPQ